MHTYLESVGFSSIKGNREMQQLIRDVVIHFDEKNIFTTKDDRTYGEFMKDYAPDMGLRVCGEFDEDGDFHPEYSFPYFDGAAVSLIQPVDFEKHAGEESYAGACDDPRIGATLIFYLNNMGEMKEADRMGLSLQDKMPVRLSALAKTGTILLPVMKSAHDEEVHQKKQQQYFHLLSEAQGGDESAIEALTTEEMKDYNIVTQRMEKEDLLSIIDSSFVPYGIECDQYSIVGNIVACEKVKNIRTNEWVWQMQIEACDVYLDVCINANRLEGEPTVGRRFSGLIWLQGNAAFGV